MVRKWLKFLFILILIIILIAVSLWKGFILDVPSLDLMKEKMKLEQASEIYSQDSVLLGKVYSHNRSIVPFNEMPNDIVQSLIASEDLRFYEHYGVDFRSLLRVVIKTILLDKNSGGGSTISQQLIKNRFPRSSYETNSILIHKIREWITAIKLEYMLSKNEILGLYLNAVPFGHNRFGVKTASKYYFNKELTDLEIHEIATLVGLLKATSNYDPLRNPNRCVNRRNNVLSKIERSGLLPNWDFEKARSKGLDLNVNIENNFIAPHFVQHVQSKLQEILSVKDGRGVQKPSVFKDGLKVYCTINSKLQMYSNASLEEHLDILQAQFNQEWTDARWNKNKSILIRLLKSKKYPGYKEVVSALQDSSNLNNEIKNKLDKMKEKLLQLRAGFVCINNSGEVLAWVGGGDYASSQYDHVKSQRQVGSIMKPIVYVTAVDQGVNICNYFKNQKRTYNEYDYWQPRNANNNYQGEYTMKGALTHSLNVISVQVLFRAGLLDVLNIARQMGIRSELPEQPSVSLGSPEISLFDMTNAYTCFPNEGQRVHTKFIDHITTANDETIYKNESIKTKELFTSDVASILTNMMESVVNNGTGRSLRTKYSLFGKIAGKTGTTQNQADGWFIGYTPEFTAGAWVGSDYPIIHFKSISKGSGSKTALPIWAKFAQKIKQDSTFSYLLQGKFNSPSDSALKCLNLPFYRD